MTIDEAIENLQTDLLIPGSVDKLDFQDAEQLGMEALKRERQFRSENLSELLPSESK